MGIAPFNNVMHVTKNHIYRTLFLCLAWATALPAGAAASEFQSVASIRAAVTRFLEGRATQTAAVRISVDTLDARLRLPACGGELQPFLAAGSRPAGRVTVGVRCAAPRTWLLYVPAQVEMHVDVVVARRPLAKGATLTHADIDVERRDAAMLRSGYFTRREDVIGGVIKRRVAAGSTLEAEYVGPALLIRRGDEVVLIAQGGGIEVRSFGEAVSDGAAGQWVKVRNRATNRIVQGQVIEHGVVQVRL